MLGLKAFLSICLFSLNIFAVEVLVTNADINFKEEISKSKLYKTSVTDIKRFCTPVRLTDLENNKYRASRYLKKGTILCTKDIQTDSQNSVLFNFGAIQIETPGKIIFENDEYIKIKRNDGKVEKIYKDGRIE